MLAILFVFFTHTCMCYSNGRVDRLRKKRSCSGVLGPLWQKSHYAFWEKSPNSILREKTWRLKLLFQVKVSRSVCSANKMLSQTRRGSFLEEAVMEQMSCSSAQSHTCSQTKLTWRSPQLLTLRHEPAGFLVTPRLPSWFSSSVTEVSQRTNIRSSWLLLIFYCHLTVFCYSCNFCVKIGCRPLHQLYCVLQLTGMLCFLHCEHIKRV